MEGTTRTDELKFICYIPSRMLYGGTRLHPFAKVLSPTLLRSINDLITDSPSNCAQPDENHSTPLPPTGKLPPFLKSRYNSPPTSCCSQKCYLLSFNYIQSGTCVCSSRGRPSLYSSSSHHARLFTPAGNFSTFPIFISKNYHTCFHL